MGFTKHTLGFCRGPARRFLASLLVAAGCCAVWGVMLRPGMVFSGMDFLNLLYPQAAMVKQAYCSGAMPLWNWQIWGGCPLLAAMQSAPLYPPMWAALTLPLPFALHLYIFAHLAFGGLGAARLARQGFGAQRMASAYAGVAYACGGFFLGHAEQVNSIAALVWAPWIFCAGLRCLRQPNAWLTVAIFAALSLLAGHPQHTVLAILFLEIYLIAYFLAVCWQSPVRARFLTGRIVFIQAGLVFAGVMTAAQLMPSLELSGLSERVRPYPDPNAPALEWQLLPALFMPRFYNRLTGDAGQPLAYSEMGLYAGILTFPLFLLGLHRMFQRRSPRHIALVAAWLAALLYALGKQGGLTPLIHLFVPFLYRSRGAARALNIETLLYAVIAAQGMSQLMAHGRKWLGGIPASDRSAARHVTAIAVLLVLVLGADLSLTHNAELNSLFVETRVLDITPPPMRVMADNQSSGRAPRLHRFMADDSNYYLDHRLSAVAGRLVRLQPDLNMTMGIALTDGYEEGLLPTRACANFMRKFNRNLRNDKLNAPLLALMGVNFVLTEYPINDMGPNWRKVGQPYGAPGMNCQLWQSDYSAGWFLDARALDQAIADHDKPGLWSGPSQENSKGARTAEPWFEPPGRAFAPHRYDSLTSAAFEAARSAANISIQKRAANSIRLSYPAGPAREILMLQNYYPGWRIKPVSEYAITAGSEDVACVSALRPAAPIYSAFTIPAIESGAPGAESVIAYEPASFRLGMFVSLASLAGVIVISARRKTGLPVHD
ncbi:MAG: hypothetical protein NTY46_10860 [Candidatus Sumerlaeota bacterium]|nr:hypothetical protein [Candidatus Sumerlaeota bacterium]